MAATGIHVSAAAAQETTPEPAAPGAFHLGRFVVRPRLNLGAIGLDTNVFYTATERRADFTASGGPGLDVALPIRGTLEIAGFGDVGYVYFARTASQRRLTGGGGGRAAWTTDRTHVGVSHGISRSFGRIGFEVDRRVENEQRASGLVMRQRIGQRLGLTARGSLVRTSFLDDAKFLGADLRTTLDRDTYGAGGGFSFALTPKTSFIVEGDHQVDEFRLSPARDADSNRAYAGLEIVSATRLSGRAVGGVRLLRLRSGARSERSEPYADVRLVYHFGPRTSLSAAYSRDIAFSAFEVTGGTPTVAAERYAVDLVKGLFGRFDLRLHGAYHRLATDGDISIPGENGVTTRVREDDTREAGADLGYLFRNRIRVGLAATWIDRRSSFADFGIHGLLTGATVMYVPR